MAADYAGKVPPPPCAPSTGKRIAIVGGGPGGLSAAYYLQLMGHQTTVFEMLPELGGMLRYGIPNYRLPKDRLNDDINAILETGVKVEFGKRIGTDMTIQSLREEYDAVLLQSVQVPIRNLVSKVNTQKVSFLLFSSFVM